MIIVKVELHSAITGRITELARMRIANDGTEANPRKGNYDAVTFRGRDSRALDAGSVQRHAHVHDWPRQQLHVWNLVQACLTLMGYGNVKTVDPNRLPVLFDGSSE